MIVGCILIALGLMMAANRGRYVYFVVGPRLRSRPGGRGRHACVLDHACREITALSASWPRSASLFAADRSSGLPVKPAGLMLYTDDDRPGLDPGRWRLTMASRLLRRQVMTLTDAAAARVRELTEAAGKPVAGLRVGVRNGGCAGMAYTMELAEAVSPLDEVVEDKGVKTPRRSQGGAVPSRRRDGLQGRPADGDLRLLQPERDLGLRLRRERRHHAGEPRAARRDGVNADVAESAVRALRRGRCQAHVRRRGDLCRGPLFRDRVGERSVPQSRRAVTGQLFRRWLFAIYLRREGQGDAHVVLAPAVGRL